MNTSEYLKQRVEDQINWYDKKSGWNQKLYKRLRMCEFVAAALIPFLTSLVTVHFGVQALVALLGAVIAVIAAAHGLFQFERNWIQYRTTCESLRKERLLYLTQRAPYNKNQDQNFTLLVRQIETLLSKENTDWSHYMFNHAASDTNISPHNQ